MDVLDLTHSSSSVQYLRPGCPQAAFVFVDGRVLFLLVSSRLAASSLAVVEFVVILVILFVLS